MGHVNKVSRGKMKRLNGEVHVGCLMLMEGCSDELRFINRYARGLRQIEPPLYHLYISEIERDIVCDQCSTLYNAHGQIHLSLIPESYVCLHLLQRLGPA